MFSIKSKVFFLVAAEAITAVIYANLNSFVSGNDWYYDNWCGGDLQYLDDEYCAKIFPALTELKSLNTVTTYAEVSNRGKASDSFRDWTCPVISAVPADGFVADGTPLSEINIDTVTLQSIVDESDDDIDLNLCLILTQRVQDESSASGVTLYNKYLCAGNQSAEVAYETWSSSKVFAAANAAGRLRSNETTCSKGIYGLDGSVTGKDGVTPFGDLTTIIASYDETVGYSSNSLSSYMHDVGFRDRVHQLVTAKDWLGLPGQSLGGNYGEATPSDLGFAITSAMHPHSASEVCNADKDPWPTVFVNSLSALAAAEMVRRLALHRELPQRFQFPGVSWRDVQEILYGAEESLLFPGLRWGGMTADTAIFMQSALNLPQLLDDWNVTTHTPDQWRIFSKLGAAYSSSRYRGEIVSNGYVCVPAYSTQLRSDATATASDALTSGGVEFTFASRASAADDPTLVKAQAALVKAVNSAAAYVLNQAPAASV